MPTYVYESIPQRLGEAVEQFEFQQRMVDAPYQRHPETGRPIRRIVTAPGFLTGAKPAPPTAQRVSRGCGCGPGCGCGT